jgi:hypothetical protein
MAFTRMWSRWGWAVGILGAAAIAGAIWYGWLGRTGNSYIRTFDGGSETLQRTVIVPTLDTPIPEGKSAIWCSTIQLCWNRLRTDVAKEPPVIRGAEAISARLNAAEQSDADLPPDSFYAAAGLVRDGVVDKIRTDMASKFPAVNLADLGNYPIMVALAFSYFETGVTYRHSYLDRGLTFRGPAGNSDPVHGFGLGAQDDSMYREVRDQVQILFSNYGNNGNWKSTEFVVDLCKYSQPNQIVLARVPRRATLAETLADVHERIERFRAAATNHEWQRDLHVTDTLLAPEMHWRIDHRFVELEGADKPFLNPSMTGVYLVEARQIIAFDMDKRGAYVKSEARMAAGSVAQHYEFDCPFLLFLKKRDAKNPFLVMWVDNAELLGKR